MDNYTQIQLVCQIKFVYDFKMSGNPHDAQASDV